MTKTRQDSPVTLVTGGKRGQRAHVTSGPLSPRALTFDTRPSLSHTPTRRITTRVLSSWIKSEFRDNVQ